MKVIKISVLIVLFAIYLVYNGTPRKNDLPLVAIANYGPHASLDASVKGLKSSLASMGLIEGKNIRFYYQDVGFDTSLIGQMIAVLVSQKPDVLVAMTTPVSQYVKGTVHNIPVVYSTLADPFAVGVAEQNGQPVLVSSDQQDLSQLLKFMLTIKPETRRVGVLYAISEANDLVLKKELEAATKEYDIALMSLAVNSATDVPTTVLKFKDKVDMIIVGTSGPIQPTLPVIAKSAYQMHIPVINMDAQAVRDQLVAASFGVSYEQVGHNAAQLVKQVLDQERIKENTVLYPSFENHQGVISKSQFEHYHLIYDGLQKQVEVLE
jgi:putative ABC transport system substrate-binding protein